MKNPICNTVFDSRDLIEYKEFLEAEMVSNFNIVIDEINEESESQREDAYTIFDVDFTLEEFKEQYSDEIEHYAAMILLSILW